MIPHANKKVGNLTIKEFEAILKYFCLLKDNEKLYQVITKSKRKLINPLTEKIMGLHR